MQGQKPYRLGIALSGGGARGFAHAGALKALEEAGIKPDVVAGVSAGAVVAVMHGAGISPEQMVRLFSNHKAHFSDFTRLCLGSPGLFSPSRFRRYIMDAVAPVTDFEHLSIDTYIGVTNLTTGRPCEFHSGPLADVMMASCSIPIIFKPVKIGADLYVDGGDLHNMPSWIIAGKCDRLIGVNVSPVRELRRRPNLADVALRSYQLMSKSSVPEDMSLCDIKVEVEGLEPYSTFGLKAIDAIYKKGYMAMKRALDDYGAMLTYGSSIN